MALAATIYNFEIELADADRGVYEPLSLNVARHPSETAEHLVTRMLAYCLEFTEGIGFSRGLAHPDDPAIAVRDLTGALLAWIDVGLLSGVVALLERRMKLALSVTGGHLFVSSGEASLSGKVARLAHSV